MELISNPWIVGISTGVISGILVFFITKLIVGRRERTEYRKRVNDANKRIVSAMKPFIADNGIPGYAVFCSMISSTARLYDVDETELYTVQEFCEELIREAVDDGYVSSCKKSDYAVSLAQYIERINSEDELRYALSYSQDHDDRSRTTVMLSMISATFAALLAMAITTSSFFGEIGEWFDEGMVAWLPLLLALLFTLLLLLIILVELIMKRFLRDVSE